MSAKPLNLTEENLAAFSGAYDERRAERDGACTPYAMQVPYEHTTSTDFVLQGKLKTVVNEVAVTLESAGNNYDVDTYIAIMEECLRDLRHIKTERRFEARKAAPPPKVSNSTPVRDVASPPPAGAQAGSGGAGNQENSVGAPSTANKTYLAAALQSKRAVKSSPKRSDLTNREQQQQQQPQSSTTATAGTTLKASNKGDTHGERTEDKPLRQDTRPSAQQPQQDRQQARLKGKRDDGNTKEATPRVSNTAKPTTTLKQPSQDRTHPNRKDEPTLTARRWGQRPDAKTDSSAAVAAPTAEKPQDESRTSTSLPNAPTEERGRKSAPKPHYQDPAVVEPVNVATSAAPPSHSTPPPQPAGNTPSGTSKEHRPEVGTTPKKDQSPQKEERRAPEPSKKDLEAEAARLKELEEQERQRNALLAQPTFQDLMPATVPQQDDDPSSQRFVKAVASSGRHGSAFSDTYQKDSVNAQKDINRSKLRPAFARLTASLAVPAVAQCKQPLNDITAAQLTENDYEYLRYFNCFEPLVKLIGEARKERDTAVVSSASTFLIRVLSDEKEGALNVSYFIRSGSAVLLMVCIREDARQLRSHNNTAPLLQCLMILQACLEKMTDKDSAKIKSANARDQLINELETLGIDRVCLGVLRSDAARKNMRLAYTAIHIIHSLATIFTRRKFEERKQWQRISASALFTLLQGMVGAAVNSAQTQAEEPEEEEEDPTVSTVAEPQRCPSDSAHTTLLFCIFRTLNTLTRWNLTGMQEIIHAHSSGSRRGGPTPAAAAAAPSVLDSVTVKPRGVVLALNAFFNFVKANATSLETISPGETLAAPSGTPNSYEEALRFGLTLPELPAFPSPQEEAATGGAAYHLRAALHESVLFIGYICFDDNKIQDMLSWGNTSTIMGNMLQALPIAYFTSARHILFPTLLAAVSLCPRNMAIVTRTMDTAQLRTFIDDEYAALSKNAKAYAQEHHEQLKQFRIKSSPKLAMMYRFRKKNWADMSDDDEAGPDANPPSDSTPSVTSASSTPFAEKEKLCKALRATGLTPNGFFKIERRFPVPFWPEVMEELHGGAK